MCGICGIYNGVSREPVSERLLQDMVAIAKHRGPDDEGFYVDGALGLGFARLSIIDLSGGHQPMSNETGDIWISYNGEIWNYQALRADLEPKGHIFSTNCDTESIIHAYEEYGLDCFSHLDGMFAFAIWDGPRKRLVLGRDRAGKKPLYYTQVQGNLVFASEIKSLLMHPQVDRKVNVQAMVDYLSIRYVPAPATLFDGIYKVLPGHFLVYEHGQIRQEKYWDYAFGPTLKASLPEIQQGIKERLYRAVEKRLMADVPVGAFLSGGVDSSLITGIMSSMTSQPVKTFAVGFDHPEYSELPYARMVAEKFKTEHHEILVNSMDMVKLWPLLTWHRDEPVSEPSDLGVYLMSKEARKHVTVVLSGEGSDELFAGYPKYVVDWIARWYHILPRIVRDRAITPLLQKLPYSMRKLQMASRNLSLSAPERWMSWFGIFTGPLQQQLFDESVARAVDFDASRAFKRWLQGNPQRDDLSSMLYLDTKIWLPDNLLMKGDKMTMGASIEMRIPFLDYQLVEYAASIPSEMKTKGFRTKHLLKETFRDFLPDAVLDRKKMGFNVPTGIWFREGQRGMLTRLLLSERFRERGYFRQESVARMLRDHLEGRTNYQAQLFTLASLELWFRVFIDPPTIQAPEDSVEELLFRERIESL